MRHAAWVVPAVAALAYPFVFLLATGPETRLLRGVLSVLVPAVGIAVLCALDRVAAGVDPLRRRAAFWAGLALVAPAVFVVASVLLPRMGVPDEPRLWRFLALPGVALIALLWRDRSSASPRPTAPHPIVLHAHRISAVVLLLFTGAHLVSHASALWSISLNRAILDTLRPAYRDSFFEAVLIAAVVLQVVTGLRLLPASLSRPGLANRLQAYSGLYFMLFVVIHTFALIVLVRNDPRPLRPDVDFFVASGGTGSSLGSYFLPYYLLGPLSFFTHLGCALRRLAAAQPSLGARLSYAGSVVVGVTVCLAITLSLLGVSVTGDRRTSKSRPASSATAALP
jgi:hypothetical protein